MPPPRRCPATIIDAVAVCAARSIRACISADTSDRVRPMICAT